MGATDTFDDLSVSLEAHLLDVLRPLPPLLPVDLSDSLSHHLRFDMADATPLPPSARQPASPSASSSTSSSSLVPTSSKGPAPTPTVPYTLLLSISKWSRTAAGAQALSAHSPSLDVQAYSMVALLAGTRTSPHRKFPDMKGKSFDPALEAKREVNDKRAIIAVFNALLSVGGAGAATWVAAQRTGWRDEWKVLFSFLAATIVAVSEIVLYMIWESRRSKPAMRSNGARASHWGAKSATTALILIPPTLYPRRSLSPLTP
ncbi:hypothetical protein EWM64_g9571 [Hericium alpestre]|uniref:Endoplasmic reticulum-based factor for assembly of V-ATPase n=1 Tax=Hericium alpestre TaxID=135208 RepID=A0A4Y9ZIF7_9AGAM|nr:hypothetical protein EWM64_g9571 [Hericium alpestre]